MPGQSAADKTEKATPERLKKARQEGQVPASQEVPSAMILTAVLISLSVVMPKFIMWCKQTVILGFTAGAGGVESHETASQFLWESTSSMLQIIVPVLVIIAVVSVASSIMVSGLNYAPKALKWNFSRVSPIKGMKNVISMKSLVKLGMSLIKLFFIGTICYLYFMDNIDTLLKLRWCSPLGMMSEIGALCIGVLVRIIIAMIIIAAVDFVYQKWNHGKELRMTKQEVKEERKQYETNPEIKGKMRSIQMQMSQKRMLADIPTADVVVCNPTHFSVAIKYDPDITPVPLVVAKGPDLLAQKIKEIARENNVPVVERPPLARALYAAVEVGQPVPNELFVAVAEVLAMIIKLKQKRKSAGFDLTSKPKKINPNN